MSTATLRRKAVRRKATRTKRGRPAADDFPCCFTELPLRLQEKAIESFRNQEEGCWHYDDSQFLTEQLVNDLEYEFGITVSTHSRPCSNGKSYDEPELYWDHYYRTVEFRGWFDLDDLLKHGDPKIMASEGECAYQPTIAALAETLALAEKAAALMGVAVSWSLALPGGSRDYTLAEYYIEESLWDHVDPGAAMDAFMEPLDDHLKAIYEAACDRCLEIIDGDIEWHYSDEYIRETLENNDCYEFDQEGDLA